MFRIRRIYDDTLPVNKRALLEVQSILRAQFGALPEDEIDGLPERLFKQTGQPFRSLLNVAEKGDGRVLGLSLLLHDPVIAFSFLDFIASDPKVPGRGVGAALYERVRDLALALGARGLFFECLPDEEEHCSNPDIRRQNVARLKFYEHYGARPITGIEYQLPLPSGVSDNLPYLVYDDLDTGRTLEARWLKRVIRAILERKYARLCPPEYVERVIASVRQESIGIRPPRYVRKQAARPAAVSRKAERLPVFVNDRHQIHHVKERGYVEAPVRIQAIRSQLETLPTVQFLPPRSYNMSHVTAVHSPELVNYLRRACETVGEGKSVYPYVFPIRNAHKPPREWSVRAGYYCIDTFTPIHQNAYPAAQGAVHCSLSAADEVLRGGRFAYALVRPPGHHAERAVFGGFCYFNNAAVAAHYLSRVGSVALLDVDYHHGNGQQDIFYQRKDVLTVSIHGDPDFAYPYFSGFEEERGEGAGEGYNINLALPEKLSAKRYLRTLEDALGRIKSFAPTFLVVSLGLDTAKGDPTGTWTLAPSDFTANGRAIAELELPTVVIQEGGYLTRTLGANTRHFFAGLLGM